MGKSATQSKHRVNKAYGPVVCFTRVLTRGSPKTTNMETILDETWRQRSQNCMFLKSVVFPQDSTNCENILDGHKFEIFNATIRATYFQQVNPFMYVAESNQSQTIVIHWGEIANQITDSISVHILSKALVDIIVLYASPLSAFVPENVPTFANWNNQNNKWFLGEWSHVKSGAWGGLSRNCVSSRLSTISGDSVRLQKLFDFLESTDKTIILLKEVLSYYDKVNDTWILKVGTLETKAERFYLFGLVIGQRGINTRYWFHENCPLDNF
jgi:hypothetical protein